jgi:hypothetical protein
MRHMTLLTALTSVLAAMPVNAQIEHMRQTIFGMD